MQSTKRRRTTTTTMTPMTTLTTTAHPKRNLETTIPIKTGYDRDPTQLTPHPPAVNVRSQSPFPCPVFFLHLGTRRSSISAKMPYLPLPPFCSLLLSLFPFPFSLHPPSPQSSLRFSKYSVVVLSVNKEEKRKE